MTKLTTVIAAIVAFAPALAFAEGNGPAFPGLQIPNVGIVAGAGPGGGNAVVTTIEHRSDVGYQPMNAFPAGAIDANSSTRTAQTTMTNVSNR